MMKVENNLSTHLVIPAGAKDGGTLKIAPKETANVEKVTGPIKDAERGGLVIIHYPTPRDKKPPADKKNGSKKE